MSTVVQLLAIKFQRQATCNSRMAMGAVTRSWSTVQTRTWESPNATLRRSTTCQKRKYGIKKYLRGRSSAQNKTENDTYKGPFKTNVLAKNTCTLSNTTLPKTGIKLRHIFMSYFSKSLWKNTSSFSWKKVQDFFGHGIQIRILPSEVSRCFLGFSFEILCKSGSCQEH